MVQEQKPVIVTSVSGSPAKNILTESITVSESDLCMDTSTMMNDPYATCTDTKKVTAPNTA